MKYAEILVGATFSFEKEISREEVLRFAEISGDFNKLHIDEAFGKTTRFGKNVVHGMLCGSLFSQIVGMYCPGENSLYLTQSLNFKAPVFCGDKVTVCGTVLGKNDSVNMITLKTEVIKDNKVVVDGEAKVKVME